MKVDLFDFELPPELIATEPIEPREAARLLVVEPGGAFADRSVGDLPEALRAGDLLVFNDTKVIPAQLEGRRQRAGGDGETGPHIGVTLHRQVGPTTWLGFVRGARKLRDGDRLLFGPDVEPFAATAIEREADGSWRLAFDVAPERMIPELHRVGQMPLPPYITAQRKVRADDQTNYQTIFAKHEGAVAAPTAGLHFTDDLVRRLKARGIESANVTLHVGAGTFLPVKVDDTDDHRMHTEWANIPTDTAHKVNVARQEGRRVVSVGTTSLRVLESAAREDGKLEAWSGETGIFITPGYHFRVVDVLLTNFHLPRSTLFMLVSALAGLDTMRAAYEHAISHGYRFYSYGDACLLERPEAVKA